MIHAPSSVSISTESFLGLPADIGFVGSFVVTVVLLLLVAWTGARARRRQHLRLVVVTVASLLVTIVFAEKLGHGYDLTAAGSIYGIHLFLAKTATLSYLAPVLTGLLTLKNARWRKLHGRIALLVILLTVAAAVTGTLLITKAPLKVG